VAQQRKRPAKDEAVTPGWMNFAHGAALGFVLITQVYRLVVIPAKAHEAICFKLG
jgi:hypothetical protein